MVIPLFCIILTHLSTITVEDFIQLHENLRLNCVTVWLLSISIAFLATLYFMCRPRNVYLVNFACYKPERAQMVSKELFMQLSAKNERFTEESLTFQKKILERSGFGQTTYAPKALIQVPANRTMAEARKETETVMFGAIDELLAKTGVKPRDIGILVVNSSLFNPTPSLSAAIVHHNSYALVVSTENMTYNWYFGNNRPMLVTNCLFRVGGAAILLSNRSYDRRRSKYELVHTLLTHKGQDDKSYNCILQQEDEANEVGVSLSKDLTAVAGEALKANITALGPLVLPLSEQLLFFANLVARKVLKMKIKPYIPDFKLAFKHFCIHAGGRRVLDELEKTLDLTQWHMEPSRMTLYRFGNTSSSSLWYELGYSEAKGRIKKRDRVWQIGLGSGFKCNSAVWRAVRTVNPTVEMNPWMDEIDKFPVQVPQVASVVY
ncbi:FAE1/Type III polyketide synthase-like protein - like 10 [Theobroma cacao]|nr:FAE1/Type III polyketide synthase-like protein - like 10 [Theobroma cacao]